MMVGRRVAVLGLSGGVLIATVAGALRIERLEQRLASLEQMAQTRVTVAPPVIPAGSQQFNLTWAPADYQVLTNQLPENAFRAPDQSPVGNRMATPQPQFPNGATAHTINGMTYYVMPLAANGGATIR